MSLRALAVMLGIYESAINSVVELFPLASFGLLLFATMGMMYPMVLDLTHEELDEDSGLLVSRLTSCCMLGTYCLYLAFQLGTHTHIFEGEEDDDDE